MRDSSTYRAARRNFSRYGQGIAVWRYGRMEAPRNDGFVYGWHMSLDQVMGTGVPKPKSAVLTDLPAAAE